MDTDATKRVMVDLLESWLDDRNEKNTYAFTFELGEEDGNFLVVEIYYPDPDSDLSGDPEWAMTPVMKAMRPETRFDGRDWDFEIMDETGLRDFKVIIDKSGPTR